MTIAIFAAAVALGGLCVALLFLAARRILGRQEQVVTAMLTRYDDRLADFAQTLNDALNQTLPGAITAAISGAQATPELPEHGVMRLLEIARERTPPTRRSPSSAPREGAAARDRGSVGRGGGAGGASACPTTAVRARSRSRSPARETRRCAPTRSAPGSPCRSSTLPTSRGCSRCSPGRRTEFSELDITTLEDVLSGTRPQLETSFELREPDPVPERDPLTALYDRPAFQALLEREIARARRAGEPLALLMLDVDRLTTLNARIGHLAADGVLAQIAALLNDAAGPRPPVPRRRRASASSSRRATGAMRNVSSSACRRCSGSARSPTSGR